MTPEGEGTVFLHSIKNHLYRVWQKNLTIF